jgi:TP901 family phage tail tape measure protein
MAIADIAINIVTKGAELAKRQLNSLSGSAGKSGNMMSKLATGAKLAGVALAVGLAKGLTEAVQEFTAFNDKMTQSLAIMNTTVEQQKAMEESALSVSRETRISAEQSAEAFFFLASAGLDAEQSISALPQVAKFAQAGMFDMATATDLATDAQSALGLTVDDAQHNLENLTRVTDVLVKANTLANSSVQQFSEALTNKAGSALKVANKGIEEGVAVLSAFADRGVKGAEAGEKLNQLLRDIPRATAKNAEEFAKLNLSMFDSSGNLKNVADLIEELDTVLAPMSDELKASTLDQLGLNRGVADAVKILSGAGDEIRAYESALMQSGGTTEDVANKQMGSLKAQLDLMNNAFSELGILIGDIIAPALTALVEGVTKTVRKFTDFISNQRELSAEIKKNVEEADKSVGLYGTKLPKAYDVYGTSVKDTTDELIDHRTATEKAIEMGTKYADMNNGRLATDQIVADALKTFTRETENNTDAIEEQTEQAKEFADTMKSKLLPSLQSVVDAQDKLKDIQDRITDAEEDRDEASKNLTKAQKELENASLQVSVAEQKLADAKDKAKQVTLEEKLAIAQQEETIRKLVETEERNEIQELQLAIAKEKLTELIEASTGATNEQTQAERELERALEAEQRATERVTKAQEALTKAQKELNEVTAKTPKNLLEIAMAKKELDDALKNLDALGSFEDGLALLVESTGMKLQDLINMANAIRSGNNISVGSGGGGDSGGGDGGSTGSETFDTDGVSDGGAGNDVIPSRVPASQRVASTVLFTQNLKFENPKLEGDELALKVAEQVRRATRNGIKVIT